MNTSITYSKTTTLNITILYKHTGMLKKCTKIAPNAQPCSYLMQPFLLDTKLNICKELPVIITQKDFGQDWYEMKYVMCF